jgi:hypothetical protein
VVGGVDLAGSVRSIGTFYRFQEQPPPSSPNTYASQLLQPLVTTINHVRTWDSGSFPAAWMQELVRSAVAEVVSAFSEVASQYISSWTQSADFYKKSGKNLNLDKMMMQLRLDIDEFGRVAAATPLALDLALVPAYQQLQQRVAAEISRLST